MNFGPSQKASRIRGWALFPQNGKEHAKQLHPPISPATGNNIVLLDIHYIVLKKIA
jgi:hypothetical protein